MVIWNLNQLLLSRFFAMYMAVRLMVIDTQDILAVRKRAFPAVSRSFKFFCHRYSFAGKSLNGKAVKVSCLRLGPKDS